MTDRDIERAGRAANTRLRRAARVLLLAPPRAPPLPGVLDELGEALAAYRVAAEAVAALEERNKAKRR
jgi:hypothetical protein